MLSCSCNSALRSACTASKPSCFRRSPCYHVPVIQLCALPALLPSLLVGVGESLQLGVSLNCLLGQNTFVSKTIHRRLCASLATMTFQKGFWAKDTQRGQPAFS